MKRIDARRHFWNVKPAKDHTLATDVNGIWGDLFPKELWPLLIENGVEGGMALHADQTEKETDYLISLAKQNKYIKGVIGWVDLQAEDIFQRLEWYRSFSELKGFRHLLHNEPRRNLMIQPAFRNGIAALQQFGFTYDMLIFPDQLRYAVRLASSFPEHKFVLDLVPGPNRRDLDVVRWREDIWALRENPHVYCKISAVKSMVGDCGSGKRDFRLYMDEMVNAFGMDRIMYGSDWPLRDSLANCHAATRLIQEYFSTFSKEEQELFFVWNAVNFYNL